MNGVRKSENQDENSFSLRRKNRRGRRANGEIPLTWQERAYERLTVLYGASKLLSRIDGVEETFKELLTYCGTTFPIATAVLIEKRGTKVTRAVWQSEEAAGRIAEAIRHANEAFSYLTGSDLSGTPGALCGREVAATAESNYVSLPLVVDQLPAFGVIQIQGLTPFDEKDLEFVEAMANLVAVAVDRFYKTMTEVNVRKSEARESHFKLSHSLAQVADLERERELRERFVSLLSHDLRTPLSAISVSAQMIERNAESTASVRALAGRIGTNVKRADRMITDLLDANRIRSGERLPIHPELFNLNELVRDTLAELTVVHGNRFQLVGEAPIDGYWDKNGIRRIVENLSSNAIKYGDTQAPVVVCLRRADRSAYIKVANRGEPIPVADQKGLFQQFRRGRKAQSGQKKGWGIGLTLVRGVADAHGGSVKLESDAEEGTRFTVQLPLDARPFLGNKAN